MPPKKDPSIKALLSDIIKNDSEVTEVFADKLVDILLPKLIAKLKEVDEFNAEYSYELQSYKVEMDKKYDALRYESALKMDSIEQHERLESVRIYGVAEECNEKGQEDTTNLVLK